MNRCVITGLPTHNKWKGNFVHKVVVKCAINCGHLTSRAFLIKASKELPLKLRHLKTDEEILGTIESYLNVKLEYYYDKNLDLMIREKTPINNG